MANTIFVKYCPVCGAENPRQSAVCWSDGEDISTVAPVLRKEGAAQPRAAEVAAGVAESSVTAIPDAPLETKRVEDVFPATASLALEVVAKPSLRFVVKDGQVVGRTAAADIVLTGVPDFDYISGRMARFFKRGEQWYIQHAKQQPTNFFTVDGEKYAGDEEVAIYDGSVIGLPLCVFRVAVPADGNATF